MGVGVYNLAISVRHCEDVHFEMFKSSDPSDPGVPLNHDLDLYTIGIRLVKEKVKPAIKKSHCHRKRF